jgi:hypothetical protein
MALETAVTEQNYLITVVVNGQSLGVFDSYSGGDATAGTVQHRPGGMGPQQSYASLAKYSGLTISRVLEPSRDWELVRSLTQIAGTCDASMTEQPLDADGNPWGNPKVFTGAFRSVKPGKVDSTSDSIRMFEIDMDVDVIS